MVHGVSHRVTRTLLGMALVAMISATAQAASPPRFLGEIDADPLTSPQMRADARLNDVVFLDHRVGWAVGDRGTILTTADGGRTWTIRESGVSAALNAVFFLDRQRGWIAGGMAQPHTKSTIGILLSTRDGGETWHRNRGPALPALKRIGFFDENAGWAAGSSTALYPSGILTTDDGGRTWKGIPGEKGLGWQAAYFFGPEGGAVGGVQGSSAYLRGTDLRAARTPPFGLRGVAHIELIPPVFGWLVGDEALVMMTSDLGATWQTPPGPLPEGVAEQFDFAAVAARGTRCWIAGSPGTRILHSDDAGRTWALLPTGQSLPIHALHFADEERGWAVGALGTILATSDGGRTWRRQRGGGRRAALLGLFAAAETVPAELFARLCGEDGYLGVAEVLGRRDVEVVRYGEATEADRLHEALVSVGASEGRTAWRFPLRQAGLAISEAQVAAGWDGANDGMGTDRLREHLVRQIRLWRPEVVITDGPNATDGEEAVLLGRLVREAVREAADPTAHLGQMTVAGLEPWEVRRVFASTADVAEGGLSIDRGAFAPGLGASLAEISEHPRALLGAAEEPAATLAFRRIDSDTEGGGGFFTGIVLEAGGEARRAPRQVPSEQAALLARLSQRHRNTRAILERTEDDPRGGAQLLAQVGELTRDASPESAARILDHLARRYEASGRWELAARVRELIAERHADHPVADASLIWLMRYYTSEEAYWRVEQGRAEVIRQTALLHGHEGESAAGIENRARAERRAELALHFAQHLSQTRPDVYAHPAVGFALAAMERRRGRGQQAERLYQAERTLAAGDAWSDNARGEQWLAAGQGVAPKPLAHAAPARTRPLLDGDLDEAFWQSPRPAPLHSAFQDDAEWPAEVRFAYDADYLFVAVRCRRAAGVRYPPAAGPRPRDSDLSAFDRVEILLDVDRNYGTYYRFAVDHRGFTAEDCWGDRSWDPTWYVAAGEDDTSWTAEVAIPLSELTGRPPRSGTAWGLGVQRTVPGVGFQSFSTPAAVEVIPEGFGYLIFD